jgi:cob(I)alamin adenosyltransferase
MSQSKRMTSAHKVRAALAMGAGDNGQTDLIGRRVPKTHPIVRLLGALDEINAMLGLALAYDLDEQTRRDLLMMQRYLYQLSAHLASFGAIAPKPALDDMLATLERGIADGYALFADDTQFIYYGGRPGPAAVQVARAICRRAEVMLWDACAETAFEPALSKVINRLSLWLFYVGRAANVRLGQTEEHVR